MIQRLIRRVLILVLALPVFTEDSPFPKHVPPIMGTAKVVDSGKGDDLSVWRIGLTIPKVRWEVVGETTPKESWPQLEADVDKVSLVLQKGGPSQLSESRVVDIKGDELRREQVLKRLSQETPVLVSVSGEIPEPYYLQLTNAEALIIILGARDGFPAPEWLPARREDRAKN